MQTVTTAAVYYYKVINKSKTQTPFPQVSEHVNQYILLRERGVTQSSRRKTFSLSDLTQRKTECMIIQYSAY